MLPQFLQTHLHHLWVMQKKGFQWGWVVVGMSKWQPRMRVRQFMKAFAKARRS